MDQLLDAITTRFQAQKTAGYLREYHDDEPTSVQQWTAAFVAAQGPQVLQYTVGSPGKVVTSWRMDLYYCVPLADRRAAFRELARIAPRVIADWLKNRRLGGVCRDMQVGQNQGGSFVNVNVAGIDCRALLLPLVIEVEETI